MSHSPEIAEAEPPPLPYQPTSRIGRALSVVLDSAIKIPGTNIRIGLDPILGLLPWGGDAVATILGSSMLFEGARKGVPARILFKMTVNTTLNALIGCIPVVGDLFSVWYRSNNRNYDLLQKHMGQESPRVILMWLMGGVCISLSLSVVFWAVLVWIALRPLLPMLTGN